MKKIILLISFFMISNLFAQQKVNFDQLNQLYYNILNYSFKGFSATAGSDVFNQLKKTLKDEKYKSALDNLSIKFEFIPKDSVSFKPANFKKTDNEKFNLGINKAIGGFEKSIKGFFQSWGSLCCGSVFEPDKYDYHVADEEGIRKITFIQDSADVTMFLSDNTNLDSVYTSKGNAQFKVYTNYITTDFNKKLVKSYRMVINNAFEIKMNIDYKSFGKIKIPSSILLSQKYYGMNQKIKLIFTNIKLKH